MTEKKRKRIVYAIFVIAVIWGLFNFPFGRSRPEYIYQEDEEYDQVEEALNSVHTQNVNVDLQGEWGGDPFARKISRSSQTSGPAHNFKLTAVSESNGEYWALINGKILSQGDSISGWKLIKITRDHAVLSANGNTITLNIQGT